MKTVGMGTERKISDREKLEALEAEAVKLTVENEELREKLGALENPGKKTGR